MSKINVLPIFRDQFLTMRDARTSRISKVDLASFYGVPITLGVLGGLLGWQIRGIGNILASLSLMAGLLFNLLILLYDTVVRIRDSTGEYGEYRRTLIRELQANVTYALTISLIVAIALGAVSVAGIEVIKSPYSFIIVSLLCHFVLLLGMILVRIRSAFLTELPYRYSDSG